MRPMIEWTISVMKAATQKMDLWKWSCLQAKLVLYSTHYTRDTACTLTNIMSLSKHTDNVLSWHKKKSIYISTLWKHCELVVCLRTEVKHREEWKVHCWVPVAQTFNLQGKYQSKCLNSNHNCPPLCQSGTSHPIVATLSTWFEHCQKITIVNFLAVY